EIEWDVQPAGATVMEAEGTPLPDRVLDSIRRNRIALKGPITTPVGTGFRSVNVSLRQDLDLFAADRQVASLPGIPSRFDGVFLETAQAIATEQSDVEFEAVEIDELALRLVTEPETFDVLLLPNLYGDIVSDLCAGLVGGLGLASGANIGWEYALFESVH